MLAPRHQLWDAPFYKELTQNRVTNPGLHIFDKQLPYQPCRLYTSLPIVPPTPTEVKTIPPNITPKGNWLGFTKDTIHE
jgi:hypothetical protein